MNGWDVFAVTPSDDGKDDGQNDKTSSIFLKFLRIFSYPLVFIVVAVTSVASKTALLVSASQSDRFDDERESIVWSWCLFLPLAVPEVLVLLRSVWVCLFQSYVKPKMVTFVVVVVVESFHAIGLVLFIFFVLPRMNVIGGAMLGNCLYTFPSLLTILNRWSMKDCSVLNFLKGVLDLFFLVAQLGGLIWWLRDKDINPWITMASTVLLSLGCWENYVSSNSFSFIRKLSVISEDSHRGRHFVGLFLSLWKITLFLGGMIGYRCWTTANLDLTAYFVNLKAAFHSVSSIDPIPMFIVTAQMASSLLCYLCLSFSSKIRLNSFIWALPISLSIPVTVSLLIYQCQQIPFHNQKLNCSPDDLPQYDVNGKSFWIWISWLMSQIWINSHLYTNCVLQLETKSTKPRFSCVLLDQSAATSEESLGELNPEEKFKTKDGESDKTRACPATIYACVTMWHETQEEMVQLLKSIFRMDEDHCARKNAQNHLDITDPNYYEFVAHVFFDDAFDARDDHKSLNSFVKTFLLATNTAAKEVHGCQGRLNPPKKLSTTPYGGQLIWTLPGGNQMVCHLKNKSQIRHRKRWSQVMYMYYLLGHRLMDVPMDIYEKEMMADNTFILTLDGDVQFEPQAVLVLVETMRKNKDVGAVGGRIYPTGSGPVIWYQIFEYAIGHWLQKTTDHVVGCSLCSPGCFSLFRAKCLMDDNVMRKYASKSEEPMHYIQYDQGEDRWLTTLVIQRGYRVEYCSESQVYTRCPETFDEFFSQRRRWIPSIMVNLVDLLVNYKQATASNKSINLFFIVYQSIFLFLTILGPATTFMSLVRAIASLLAISRQLAFVVNAIPIAFFVVVCFAAKNNVQLLAAKVLGVGYAFLMTFLQVDFLINSQYINQQFLLLVFLFLLSLSPFVAACLHPREFRCVFFSVLYSICLPISQIILIIYTVVNVHVVTWGTREVERTPKTLDTGDAKPRKTWYQWTNPAGANDNQCRQLLNRVEKLEKTICETTSNTESGEDADNSEIAVADNNETKQKTDDTNLKWYEDRDLKLGAVQQLPENETRFWMELIEKYLYPLDYDEEHRSRMTTELKRLRNKIATGVFVINGLFILVILAVQQESHKIDQFFNGSERENPLELDSVIIGIFFGLLVVLQTLAMMCHRFAIFLLSLSATRINCSETENNVSEAIRKARDLQKLTESRKTSKDEKIISIEELELRKKRNYEFDSLEEAFLNRLDKYKVKK